MRCRPFISALVTSFALAAIALALPSLAAASGDAAGPMSPGTNWSSSFQTGNFHQWSWWGQGQSSIWGKIGVVKAKHVGIPQLNHGQSNIARMTVTSSGPTDGQINAKLYKGFATWHNGVQREPRNVSGTYSADYYIPASYQIHGNDAWANIFQFKEQYIEPGGQAQSDALWWVQLASASWAEQMGGAHWIGPKPTDPNAPVAFLNRWCNNWKRQLVLEAVPRNHWFSISANLVQGKSLSVSINGRHFDTAYQSQYPVSPFHSSGNEWIFGVGNYATAPNTTLYVGGASYTPSHAG
jgi:hypothetical protein